MQLAWNTETDQPIQVINTQMAEFEIADIKCTVENVTYKAGLSKFLFIKLQGSPEKLLQSIMHGEWCYAA